jgi:hypothetical protein
MICTVLKLMALLGLERGRVERELIFRSQLLETYTDYLMHQYGPLMSHNPGGVPPSQMILQ